MKSLIKFGIIEAVVLFCSQCTKDVAATSEPKTVEVVKPQRKVGPEPNRETVALANCINRKNGNDTRTRQYSEPFLLAHTRARKGKDNHIVNGYLGHHVTWAINVDVSADPAVAYETFGPGAERE